MLAKDEDKPFWDCCFFCDFKLLCRTEEDENRVTAHMHDCHMKEIEAYKRYYDDLNGRYV